MKQQNEVLPASIEEAFKMQGIDFIMPDLSVIPERFREPMLAFYQLMVGVEAVNGEDYDPNWDDYSEPKYEPVFGMNGPGFRFGDVVYGAGRTGSFVGSRLCLKDYNRLKHAAQTFLPIYKKIMVKEKGERK